MAENDFQCKTLEKRRYLDFPSNGFYDGKSCIYQVEARAAETVMLCCICTKIPLRSNFHEFLYNCEGTEKVGSASYMETSPTAEAQKQK